MFKTATTNALTPWNKFSGMIEIRESDWKKFTALLPVWRERYLTEKNPRIAALLTEPGKTETERFWAAEKVIEKEARTLQRCLDDIRRSRMIERLLEMRLAKMISREDLADFSAGAPPWGQGVQCSRGGLIEQRTP